MLIDKMEIDCFSTRTQNCLRNAGITTYMELNEVTEKQLKKIRNFGLKSLKEVMEYKHRFNVKQDSYLIEIITTEGSIHIIKANRLFEYYSECIGSERVIKSEAIAINCKYIVSIMKVES